MSKFRAILVFTTLVLALGLAVPAWAGATSSANNAPKPNQYILPGDSVFPEGIAYQRKTDNFFVSSTTDGTIFRGNIRDQTTSVFLPGGADGRTTATGMKVDKQGRLFISGAGTGRMFVYDTANGALLGAFNNNLSNTFINDVALNPKDGAAYFTDSLSPFLYRVARNAQGELVFSVWLDFTGTVVTYQSGFNLNGIAASHNGKYLIVVQSNTGKLFRIDTRTKAVTQIDLNGQTLINGDGILLRGHTLYVVRNQQELIVKVRMAEDFSRGTVVSSTTDPSFAFPTTIARAKGRLLVVNSQFDKRGPGLTPELPFTVSSVPIP
jgi:DNA-binding beta-propeller fold protein YncE